MTCKTEQQIINQWSHKDKIYVSVLCMTFNQCAFLEQTLDSILSQVTPYKFEIIIHDDASTDGTSEIIEKYQKMYPEIIKPIVQERNTYSVSPTLPTINAVNAAQGQYISICEGDDYWISTGKLHRQLLEMFTVPNIKLSFHKSKNVYPSGKITTGVDLGDCKRVLSLREVIEGGGGMMPTASLMFHRDIVTDINTVLPVAPVGDYYMQVLGAKEGGALYIPGLESAYRKEVEGSWTANTSNLPSERIEGLLSKHEAAINKLSKLVGSKYQNSLNIAYDHECYVGARIALKSGNFELFKCLITKGDSNFGMLHFVLRYLRNRPRLSLSIFQFIKNLKN